MAKMEMTLFEAVTEETELGFVLSCKPLITRIRESVGVSCILSYLDRLRSARHKCGGVKGNLVRPIIPLMATIDWIKWNRIQNSLSLRKHLLGETSVLRGGKDVPLLTLSPSFFFFSMLFFLILFFIFLTYI